MSTLTEMHDFNISEAVLYEDDYIIVINKPAGLMVQPDRNQNRNLLDDVKDYLCCGVPKKEIYLQHIHRLDRPVSGIVLFAKQRSVLRNLSEQFAQRHVKKYYNALTETGPFQSRGVLEHWHRKEKKKAAIYDEEIQYSERVSLQYKVTSLTPDTYLWDIELHTGKFHQIRAQLSHVGCPVIGDLLYGSHTPFAEDTIALHAYKLVFTHPISAEGMTILSKTAFSCIKNSVDGSSPVL